MTAMNATEKALWEAMEDSNLVDTKILLAAIGTPKVTRTYIEGLYAIAMRFNFGQIEWPEVNKAIIGRWSLAALKAIKKRAWAVVEEAG